MSTQPYILNGSRVKVIRKGLGLSRADLAEAMGLARTSAVTIGRIENEKGDASEKTAQRVADALGVFLSDLTRHGPEVRPWPQPAAGLPPEARPWLRRGSVGRPLAERLSEKIQVDEAGCWIWQCRLNRFGYGEIKVSGGKRVKAHRAMYEQHVGPIPDGLDLDHLCRVRSCVNPAHLEPVTRLVNIRRIYDRTSTGDSKTHCLRGHEMTPENTRAQLRSNGRWSRACKTCVRDRAKRLAAA